jgi:hypothetical protein
MSYMFSSPSLQWIKAGWSNIFFPRVKNSSPVVPKGKKKCWHYFWKVVANFPIFNNIYSEMTNYHSRLHAQI